MGKTSTASKCKYNAKAYDRVSVMVKKGDRERYKQQAAERGYSLNAYIIKLLDDDSNR